MFYSYEDGVLYLGFS